MPSPRCTCNKHGRENCLATGQHSKKDPSPRCTCYETGPKNCLATRHKKREPFQPCGCKKNGSENCRTEGKHACICHVPGKGRCRASKDKNNNRCLGGC